MNSDVTIPLTDLPNGVRAVVRRVTGGHELSGRLAALGIAVDAVVDMLQNSQHGPLLVRVRNTRLALGRGEAVKILVEKVNA